MPIRLNLLSEEYDQRGERFRDPRVLGYFVSGACCLLVSIYSLSVFLKRHSIFNEVSARTTEWTQNEKKYVELEGKLNESIVIMREIESLQRYSTNRFLWGPVLNDIQSSVVPNIYLSGLIGKQEIVYEAERTHGNDKIPAQVTQKTSLTMRGFDSSPDRHLSVNTYSKQLVNQPNISSLVSNSGQMRLIDVGLRRNDPFDPNITYVGFTTVCVFDDKIHK